MDDLGGELRKTGHSATHVEVEIRLRASPKGTQKTILTVVRDEEWSRFDTPQATRQLGHGWKAWHVKVHNFGHVLGREPEGISTRRVPREQDDALPCDTTQLGEPCGLIAPVVHREDGQRRVKRRVCPWEVFGSRLDHGRCSGRPLANHRKGWLHRHHLQVSRLIGTGAGTYVEHRARLPQRHPDGLGNTWVWLACGH